LGESGKSHPREEPHQDMLFHVYTHGGPIDRTLADRIARCGNIIPAISIGGFKEETDQHRGPHHFGRIIKAMGFLKEAGVIFGFSATHTRVSHEIITNEAFIDFLIEQGCLLGWYFMYIPVGREPNLELRPTPGQRDALRERVDQMPILLADFWNDGPAVGGYISGAPKYFHINDQGDIEPWVFCHFARHNIKTTPLKEALNSSLFKAIKGRQFFYENLLRPCMLVDNPEMSRRMALESGPYFTHPGAEGLFSELAQDIYHFADGYTLLAQEAWQKHCQSKEV
jgi:MoaA/NifB/PqqE/SkfB family radical SAM enzyme